MRCAIPAIIGGGITGVVLARALAEQGHRVHLYEAADKFGGVAQQRALPFTLDTESAQHFFARRTSFFRRDDCCYPETSWHALCQQLLSHPSIKSLCVAPIVRWDLLTIWYENDMVINTTRLDTFFAQKFGELLYVQGVPIRTRGSTARYEQYVQYAQQRGIHLCGMHGNYYYMTIEECIVAALAFAAEKGNIGGNISRLETQHGI